jgi:hypothetical protein
MDGGLLLLSTTGTAREGAKGIQFSLFTDYYPPHTSHTSRGKLDAGVTVFTALAHSLSTRFPHVLCRGGVS